MLITLDTIFNLCNRCLLKMFLSQHSYSLNFQIEKPKKIIGNRKNWKWFNPVILHWINYENIDEKKNSFTLESTESKHEHYWNWLAKKFVLFTVILEYAIRQQGETDKPPKKYALELKVEKAWRRQAKKAMYHLHVWKTFWPLKPVRSLLYQPIRH